MRNNGNALRHLLSPARRYVTATTALRLSSPVIFHSKPSDRSVGRSTTMAPGVTALSAALAPPVRAHKTAATMIGCCAQHQTVLMPRLNKINPKHLARGLAPVVRPAGVNTGIATIK